MPGFCGRSTSKSFFVFAVVGAAGFSVDACVFMLLSDYIGHYAARPVSFFVTVVFTWLVNRRVTFFGRESGVGKLMEFLLYFYSMCFGGAVNLLVYYFLTVWIDFFKGEPLVALGIGSVCGLVLNFILSASFVFKREKMF